MPLQRSILKDYVLFPFLLPVFFAIHGLLSYFGLVELKDAGMLAIIYLGVAAILFGGSKLISRDNKNAGILTFLVLLLLLYWGDVLGLSKEKIPLTWLVKIPVFLVLWIIVIGLGYILFKRQKETVKRQMSFYLNLLFVIYLLVDVCMLSYKYALRPASRQAAEIQASQNSRTAAKNWNVYFILFDEYAGSKALKEEFNFDNSTTDSFLLQHKFSLQQNSRSNYASTFFSMASMLNMDYVRGFDPNAVKPYDYSACLKKINQSSVAAIFMQSGYTFSNCSFFDVQNMPALTQDPFLMSGAEVITAHTLYDVFVKDYMQFLHLKPGKEFYRVNTYNNNMLALVTKLAKEPKQKPIFVYCHLSMPHPPFFYDKNGRLNPVDTVNYANVYERTRFYLYNLQHANEKMKALVDSIQKYDSNAAILLMGDHGYRKVEYNNDPVKNYVKFQNLNAICFPDHDYTALNDSMTNVNLFRIVLNKTVGTAFPLLKDSTIELIDK